MSKQDNKYLDNVEDTTLENVEEVQGLPQGVAGC